MGDPAGLTRLTDTLGQRARAVYDFAMSLVVEHGRPAGRRGRCRKAQVAVGIAAVEAILVLVSAIPWWLAVLAAVAAVAAYLGFGRDHDAAGVRSATWVAAVSQLIVVLIPVGVVLVGLIALVVVTLLAAVALVVLLLDRR